MRIAGLQKMTLLDYPGHVACTVFLGGCNFRCPYCHNSELLEAPPAVMTREELLAFLEKRRGLLDGVCITGGEPTLHPELPALLRAVRAMGFSVKLDTNGYRPDVLQTVLAEGLVDYVAMDVKNGPDGYAAACGLADVELSKIEKSISLLMSESVGYELRTTVVHPVHTEAHIRAMAQWVSSLGKNPVKRWFLQPFADRDTVPFSGLSAPSETELNRFVQIVSTVAEQADVRGIVL